MPFSLQWVGAEELMRKMDRLPEKAAKVAAEALYEGAGVMADTVSRAVQGIATEPFHYATGGQKRKPSPEEKAALLNARHGIAKFRYDGTEIRTSIGFQQAGYADVNGRRKPLGQIANSIASGTSFMDRQPVFRKAKNAAQGAAKAAIVAKAEKMYDEIINGSGL